MEQRLAREPLEETPPIPQKLESRVGGCILSLTEEQRRECFTAEGDEVIHYFAVRCPIASCMTLANIDSIPAKPLEQGPSGWDDCYLDRLTLR